MYIRPFQPADLEAVLDLWLSANLSAHAFLPAAYWTSRRAEVGEQLPRAEVWVCVGEGEAILGFAGLTGSYLAGLFVAEGARSQGTGASLLDHLKARCPRLTLQVYLKNHRAVRFYLREGFRLHSLGIDPDTGEPEALLFWSDGALSFSIRQPVSGAPACQTSPQCRAGDGTSWDTGCPAPACCQGDLSPGELWQAVAPDGRVLGMICMGRNPDPASEDAAWGPPGPAMAVRWAAADPAVRRRGVASSLLLHAVALACAEGRPSLRASIDRENLRAQALFRKLGFLPRGQAALPGRLPACLSFECSLSARAGQEQVSG